jgi:trans-2,3-dihydro-3-hydroxyanthranilate isomerase
MGPIHSMQLVYEIVDVFTQEPLAGNALAVFPDARELDSATMQSIARELNLAETAFVLPAKSSGCTAQVRIFTPAMEMTFAGHPTIGTSYVLRMRGAVPKEQTSFVLEEKVGKVAVRVDPDDDPLIWLQTPPISRGRTFSHEQAAAITGLAENDLLSEVPVQVRSAGNPCLYVGVRDKSAVDRAWVELSAQRKLFGDGDPTCVFLFAPTAQGAYSRMFAPEHVMVEDAATGSATGPLAAIMMEYGLSPAADGTRFVSEQGTKMGRRSFLHVLIRGRSGIEGIDVGGHVRHIATATMFLQQERTASGRVHSDG